MNESTGLIKDESLQQPVPPAWRSTIEKIVDSLVCGNFQLVGIECVRSQPLDDAQRLRKGIEQYGRRLTKLPVEAWETSVCLWMGLYWDVFIDLYTEEEGLSDLVLAIRIWELDENLEFEVLSAHVP
ncbi:DUF7668 domain-containing protein [Stenotrophomonas panacihumi]|uniref:DUF7668 domain-containing protein n=1 Tax=Stenotrophomonas panacihumi TaxID=676599 RepID=UPI0011B23919|nr:hypothetical protein [Stenotrophomonas panacihumi]